MAETGTETSGQEIKSDGEVGEEGLEAILLKIVQLLRPMNNQSRIRTVRAALTFLGTPVAGVDNDDRLPVVGKSSYAADLTSVDEVNSGLQLSRRAQIWMTQNSLDFSLLDAIFHRTETGVELIAHDLPGRTNKEKVLQCYLLTGLQTFLTGVPGFEDETARTNCRDMGCYDKGNHSTYVKAIGNLMAGTKGGTYELTQPGLRRVAELVRSMTSTNEK